MQQVLYPEQKSWPALHERPTQPADSLADAVKEIFDNVDKDGDLALLSYTRKFDWKDADRLMVSERDWVAASSLLSCELKDAIGLAAKNIERFHTAQRETSIRVETMPGVMCWRESRPIKRVGIYIPGGEAPLFSTVLMLAIPARIAGCSEIVLCTPPDEEGKVHPAILYAARLTGVTSVFRIGGAQAIAAMTLGTTTVPRVDKIFGPGNQYVTAAKLYAQRFGMPIDLPAGPSEVLIIADNSAIPAFVAADLLSQAEHGPDSQVMVVSDCPTVIGRVLQELKNQLDKLPRRDIASQALGNSKAVVLPSLDDCISFSNGYAPEHLIIATGNAQELAAKVTNAGSVFIGNYSCESAGDYASGTNHTLPTGGYARCYSGVSLDSFIRKISFQSITRQGLASIGPAIELMAEAEGLVAHKNAVSIRLREEYLRQTTAQTEQKMRPLEQLVRPNIRALKGYSSARSEYKGEEGVFLDANENPYGSLNRYPDPQQRMLKERLGKLRCLPESQIFIGNGSDEIIDLCYRIFCRPGIDAAITFSPGYGMYDTLASINDVQLIKFPLNETFQIDVATFKPYLGDEQVKLIIACSPNNPTGNLLEGIGQILNDFNGIVLVDEAYIDFADTESWVSRVNEYPNLIVSQTLSKANGLAAARIGVAYARGEIVELLNKVKAPYNISALNQAAALDGLSDEISFRQRKEIIIAERGRVTESLSKIRFVKRVYPSDANFLLVEVDDADWLYSELAALKIITRNRNAEISNCIRITIGKPEENELLLAALKAMEQSNIDNQEKLVL